MGRIGRGQSIADEKLINIQQLCFSLLDDLVSKSAAQVYLRCGARAVRVLELLGLSDDSVAPFKVILEGDNKHGKNFIEEVSKELA